MVTFSDMLAYSEIVMEMLECLRLSGKPIKIKNGRLEFFTSIDFICFFLIVCLLSFVGVTDNCRER